MKYIKIGVIFAVSLLLYFIPSLLFKVDPAYYTSLMLPSYAPPALLFGIAWPILYVIFSLYIAIKLGNQDLPKEMIVYFMINYIISFFFNKVFFVDHNLFLTFAVTFCCFLTGLFLFITSFKKNKKEFLVFLPYLLWTLFATILMAHIYLIN
ncbi:MAG: tryptophan-rich sensory protein [Roseburia sp.]|nr:tryptophan-rich sensory protein [Anaeroplasma bactoclasticum]MCM1196950.1 tryptophan-rich sensory protein [Roseburia sp.]MCM1557442.1 tryptophan-rich sensory protein [Anaeroplasma bactoclasticum]